MSELTEPVTLEAPSQTATPTPASTVLPPALAIEPQLYPRNRIVFAVCLLVLSPLLSPLRSLIGESYWFGAIQFWAVLPGVVTLVALFLYVDQLRYVAKVLQKTKLVIMHLALLIGGSLIVGLASLAGDIAGYNDFNGNGGPLTPKPFIVGFLVAALFLFIPVFLASTVFVATGGKKRVLNIIGKVFYILLWIACCFAAYFGYGIAYSLRDPSSE